MRDPRRVYTFCLALAELWSRIPDWRFGQLMCNIYGDIVSNWGDPFFKEDDEMLELLAQYIDRVAPKKEE